MKRRSRRNGPVVVCVDDEAPVLAALTRTLRGEPYELVTTREPGQVLEWLDRRDVAVVIADQRMPRTSGAELLAEVRRRSPRSRRVILTAFPESSLLRARADESVERLLTKPWDGEGLRRTVRELLRERSGGAGLFREIVLAFECRGRAPEELLREIAPELTRVDAVRRGLVIFLKNLTGLSHSIRGFVERLAAEVARAGVRATVVEPSGLTAVLLDPLGEIGPLIVCAPRGGEKGRRVLLVDSRAEPADFLHALLESAGHACVRAATPSRAAELLREREFDVVVLDLAIRPPVRRAVEEGLAAAPRRPELVGFAAPASRGGGRGREVDLLLPRPAPVRQILRAVAGLERGS